LSKSCAFSQRRFIHFPLTNTIDNTGIYSVEEVIRYALRSPMRQDRQLHRVCVTMLRGDMPTTMDMVSTVLRPMTALVVLIRSSYSVKAL
jgi:hypothetical protein